MKNDILAAIQSVAAYWNSMGIISYGIRNFNCLNGKIRSVLNVNDFSLFYSSINGMTELYPNEMDENGFLIYPIENIEIFKIDDKEVFIFANYLQKCWWYGFVIENNDIYEIGIVKEKDKFEKRFCSLSDFLYCYVDDCDCLY